MSKELNLLAAIILQEPRAGFLTNPDKSRSHFIEVDGEKIVCLAKGGECRHYGEFYTGSLNCKESWVTPIISESCPDACPYKYLVCEGGKHKDHNYTEYYPQYNKYCGEFSRYCKHFELISKRKPIEQLNRTYETMIDGYWYKED